MMKQYYCYNQPLLTSTTIYLQTSFLSRALPALAPAHLPACWHALHRWPSLGHWASLPDHPSAPLCPPHSRSAVPKKQCRHHREQTLIHVLPSHPTVLLGPCKLLQRQEKAALQQTPLWMLTNSGGHVGTIITQDKTRCSQVRPCPWKISGDLCLQVMKQLP